MSAETLRKAAALMRERAEAATEGPWRARLYDGHWQVVDTDDEEVADCDGSSDRDNDHIASWHPAVALAVADWLDKAANDYERAINLWQFPQAFTVARAYLGEA